MSKPFEITLYDEMIELAFDDFNPQEARETDGKWTAGASGGPAGKAKAAKITKSKAKITKSAPAPAAEPAPAAPADVPPGVTNPHGTWTRKDTPLAETYTRKPPDNSAKWMQVAYHGTYEKALQSILDNGIVPGKGGGADDWWLHHGGTVQSMEMDNASRKASVFISTSEGAASSFADLVAGQHQDKPVILAVQIPAEEIGKVAIDEASNTPDAPPAYRFIGPIKPEWIRAIAVAKDNKFGAGKIGVNGPNGKRRVTADAAPDLLLYLVPVARPDMAQDAFDPSEPRKGAGEAGGGEWTSGGAGGSAGAAKPAHSVAFVSPNVAHVDLKRAEKGLSSTRQRELVKAGTEIDKGLGLHGKSAPCIGAWADGAENSLMSEFGDCSLDTLKVAAAMRGYLADQKQVLIFRSNPAGSKRLYRFDATGDIETIHDHLLEDGLQFHTLAPTKGGATVFIYGEDGDTETAQAVLKGASRYGSAVQSEAGDGEFLGTEKQDGSDREQRDDARQIYARAIEGTGNRGYHDLWAGVHSAYGETLLKPLEGSVGHPDLISSRNVTSKGVSAAQKEERADSAKNYRRVDVDAMRADPKLFKHNVGLFANAGLYPMFRPDELKGTADQKAAVIQKRMEDNIQFIYDQVAPEDRKSWARWYDGANTLINNDAKSYGLPEASVAGAYAALSPGQLWDINVWMGKKVVDTYMRQQDTAWSPAMDAAAKTIFSTTKNQALLSLIEGKKLSELSDPVLKGAWIRTFVEADDPARQYRRVTPEGGFSDLVRNNPQPGQKEGRPSKAGWQGFAAIGNAIKCLDSNGDRELISDALGEAHKVRSFYDNMLDPDSPNGDVTIDTHAMGAAFLSPWGQRAEQVAQGFGTGIEVALQSPHWEPAKSSSVTGVSGTYPLYADAYRNVAKAVGIEPRQLQSIVWEAKREMFDDNSPRKAAQITLAWQAYRNGEADLPATQRAIADIAMRPKEPKPKKGAAK